MSHMSLKSGGFPIFAEILIIRSKCNQYQRCTKTFYFQNQTFKKTLVLPEMYSGSANQFMKFYYYYLKLKGELVSFSYINNL